MKGIENMNIILSGPYMYHCLYRQVNGINFVGFIDSRIGTFTKIISEEQLMCATTSCLNDFSKDSKPFTEKQIESFLNASFDQLNNLRDDI